MQDDHGVRLCADYSIEESHITARLHQTFMDLQCRRRDGRWPANAGRRTADGEQERDWRQQTHSEPASRGGRLGNTLQALITHLYLAPLGSGCTCAVHAGASRLTGHLFNGELHIHERCCFVRHLTLAERVKPLRDSRIMWGNGSTKLGSLRRRGTIYRCESLHIVSDAPLLRKGDERP
jgi:hypothetical protein